MREFTVRNKAKNPIITFTPATLALLLAARPESVSLVLAKLVQDYKTLTGKTLTVDHEQNLQLLAHAGADDKGVWKSRYSGLCGSAAFIRPFFTDGFMRRTVSGELAEDLAIAETFHAMLDTLLATQELENCSASLGKASEQPTKT